MISRIVRQFMRVCVCVLSGAVGVDYTTTCQVKRDEHAICYVYIDVDVASASL